MPRKTQTPHSPALFNEPSSPPGPSDAPVDRAEQNALDEQAAGSLLEHLAAIPDARDPKGVRYPLAPLLALCVVAFLCGKQNLSGIRRFGKLHPEFLLALGMKRKRSPSVPTLSRVLGSVKISDLQQAFAAWFRGLVDSERKRQRCAVAAVDGKTSRACGAHVLNVFLHDVRRVIWQAPVDEKANEISAFKTELDGLIAACPFLQILTGDAMFAGAPLCSALIENGRHYVFQVKADQRHLHEKLGLLFAPQLNRPADPAAAAGKKKKGLRRCARGVVAGLA